MTLFLDGFLLQFCIVSLIIFPSDLDKFVLYVDQRKMGNMGYVSVFGG